MRPSWRLSLVIGLGFAAVAVADLFPLGRGTFHWVLAAGFALLSAYYLVDARRRFSRERTGHPVERHPGEPPVGRRQTR